MIPENFKQQLVKNTIDLLQKMEGRISYKSKEAVRYGNHSLDEMSLAVFCLANTVIGHNIPVYPNGVRSLRDYPLCWRASDVFGLTNIDERFFIETSKSSSGFEQFQKFGEIKIGRLAFRDNSHEFFESGSGGSLCDFIDLDHNYLIEAKYNYFSGGSPSSLHDAEYLLDYGDYDAYLYKTVKIGNKVIVPVNSKPIAYFEHIMKPRRHLNSIPGLSEDLMQLIRSGELIPLIENGLAEKSFKWNF